MRDFYLHIDFCTLTGSTTRVVRVQAPSILAAARDAEHICNGYYLGTGRAADLARVTTRPAKDYLYTTSDFKGPLQ